MRRLRPLCPAYTERVGAHTRPDQLLVLVDRHREQFNRDNNFGLVRQCEQSFHKMSIQRLTRTLSLEDAAARVQLPIDQTRSNLPPRHDRGRQGLRGVVCGVGDAEPMVVVRSGESGVRVEWRVIPLKAELMAWSAEWRARSEG